MKEGLTYDQRTQLLELGVLSIFNQLEQDGLGGGQDGTCGPHALVEDCIGQFTGALK